MNSGTGESDQMTDEHDFSRGVRGKFAEGCNVVVLDPDIADLFPDSESVNDALRTLADTAAEQSKEATD